jgi:4-hydroxyproline epimerase
VRGWERIQVIDSHTGGEPTRVVVAGGPDLGTGSLTQRRARFAEHFDHYRSAIVNEPRGSDVVVGALLVPPADPACVAGVIFFNNVGTIWMCGHGTIGLVVTLAHLGRIGVGRHRVETPVGVVAVEFHGDNRVTIENVPSYRHAANVAVEVPEVGVVTGDIAWGGNWFFLVRDHDERLELENVARLTDVTCRIRRALASANVTGTGGGEIDHIELFGPPRNPTADSRNFVLCPGRRLRPLPLRHRHQRQARLPDRRRQARARQNLAAGEHHRQPFRGFRADRGRPSDSEDHGNGLHHRRSDADRRPQRSLLLGHY